MFESELGLGKKKRPRQEAFFSVCFLVRLRNRHWCVVVVVGNGNCSGYAKGDTSNTGTSNATGSGTTSSTGTGATRCTARSGCTVTTSLAA